MLQTQTQRAYNVGMNNTPETTSPTLADIIAEYEDSALFDGDPTDLFDFKFTPKHVTMSWEYTKQILGSGE